MLGALGGKNRPPIWRKSEKQKESVFYLMLMMIRKWSLLQMEAPQRIYSDLFASTLKVLLSTSRPYQAPSFGAGSSEKLLEISETNKSTESPSLSIKIFL